MGSESDPLGLVGTTVADKYAIESVVGEGGFAIVYRAIHVLWKRPVAVKVFKALDVAASERPKLLDDFIQEGVLLAELSERSTAICQARDVGMLTCQSGQQAPYMVLEWLDGKPLDVVLADERAAGAPLRSLEETVRLLDPIAEALALAHKKGIAHRDVKPANVFVLGDPRGEDRGIKLLDFGIAKVVQDAQKMGFAKTSGHVTSFTPAYGAPEQFNRAYGATGPWTDVFALALMTLEVLTGRDPIAGDNLVQLAYAASDPGTRPTPRTFGLHVSDEVEAVFRKAVAVAPADRYATAGELWNALRTVVLGHPMSSSVTRSDPALPGAALPSDSAARAVDVASARTELAPAIAAPSPSAPTVTGAVAEVAPAGAPPRRRSPAVAITVAAALLGGVGFVAAKLRGGGAPAAGSVAPPASSPPAAAMSAPVARACPAGMIYIPGGEYFIGSDEKNAEPNEKPPHKVKLAAYCLDEHEVTVAEYKACSDRGGCLRASKENSWTGITAAQQKIYDPLCNANDPVGRAEHPINCVDWNQARKFCEARDARLPTEAEWEFAARGMDGRTYPWGEDPPSAGLLNACGGECVAWMKKNPDPDQPIASMYPEDDGFPTTAPVGRFPAGNSRWGAQDMAGNVWEWVADWYADYDPASASTVTTDPRGPETGTERIIRGGSWNGAMPSWVRPAWRFKAVPSFRTHGIGFRCAAAVTARR